VKPTLCFPGKEEVAKLVARITGKEMASVEDLVAVPRCARKEGGVQEKEQYVGYRTCSAADLAFGGPMACRYACVGFGDCAAACPFDAIVMVDHFPVVDPHLCVGCGTCVRTCPKGIIELIPTTARVFVPCSSKDSGKMVKDICTVGCISCRMCVKSCPAEAVSMENNVINIDHKKCMDYGPDCGEICVEKCPTHIFRHFSLTGKRAEKESAAVAA
jgi:Na+-translocating ferredoxin:NAD+ oxidoreductase subunit B